MKNKQSKKVKLIDRELVKELCLLERNFAQKYEKKSGKELDDICKI